MQKKGLSLLFVMAAILVISMGGPSAQAAVPNPKVDPFPIGIFWSPSAEDTTFENYKEIKDMNATYVFLTNGVSDYAENDAALVQCAANGLKCVVQEDRLGSYRFNYLQNSGDDGDFLNYEHSFGQTFTTPDTPDIAIASIQLFMDENLLADGEKISLRIYDSPSKTTLLGSSSITGPTGTIYPTFYYYKWFTPNTTYYMELTSDGPLAQSYVIYNTTDVYSGGTAFEDGVAKPDHDLWFNLDYGRNMYRGGAEPYTADIIAFANHYKSNEAFLGYHLSDEPPAAHMTGLQSTIERFRAVDPDHLTYVNLLPTYASNYGFGELTGAFVTPDHELGQTFKTNSDTTSISTIQLYIDNTNWNINVPLTLKLWDSPVKTTLLAQNTISGSSTKFPLFTLDATVSPNTTYYWELTNGGGDESSVGWVVMSSGGVKWEKDGMAYIAGNPSNADFWFSINQNLTPFSYEDYIYRWASKKPDFMMYDHYPYSVNGGFSAEYYTNMEIVRRQSLLASIDFWTYIQSVGITGALKSPSEGEMKYQVYSSLAYGAKGINYFTYVTPTGQGESFHDGIILPDGTQSPLYTYVKDINAGVLKLGPTLNTLVSQEVYHTGTLPASTTALPSNYFWNVVDSTQPLVIGSFENSSGRKYVMVVNRDYKNSKTVSFDLPGKPSTVTEISKTTGAEVATNYIAASGVLSSDFAPGEGRLYALPLEGADAKLSANITAPTNSDVIVTISYPEDAIVKEYKVGESGIWSGYTAPIVISENGTVYARGTDAVGNVSSVTNLVVNNIDKIAPISVATVSPAVPNGNDGWYTSNVTVSITASDNVSGIASTEYQVNDGVWITYNGSIPAFGEGTYKISYRSMDQAGNVEQSQTMNVKVKSNTTSIPSTDGGNIILAPVRQEQIVDKSDLNDSQNGKVTLLMKKGYQHLVLPINSASLLGSNKLEIKAEGVSMLIPSEVFAQLTALLGKEANIKDHIVLTIEKLDATATNERVKLSGGKNIAVRAGNDIYQFSLAVIDSKDKEYSLDVFNKPVEIELYYNGDQVNADLLGIYYYNETSNQWEYVGGMINKQKKTITTKLNHFSQYAVIEYNKTFDDIPSNHWVNDALKALAAKHVVTGLTDTTFVPQGEITRAEFTAMLTRLLGLEAKGPSTFTDVDPSEWYADAVGAAFNARLVEGRTAAKFGPNEKISREEMTVMLVRAYEYKNDKAVPKAAQTDIPFRDSDQISAWAVEYVQSALGVGLMQGVGKNKFNPAAFATRAEAAQAIYNLSISSI